MCNSRFEILNSALKEMLLKKGDWLEDGNMAVMFMKP